MDKLISKAKRADSTAGGNTGCRCVDAQFKAFLQGAMETLQRQIPDGAYPVEVVDARMGATTKGKPKVSWTLRITSGEFSGREIEKVNVITSRKAAEVFLQELALCGFQLDSTEEVMDAVNSLKGTLLMVRKVTNERGYVTVYLNEYLGRAEMDAGGQGSEQPSGNDGEDNWLDGLVNRPSPLE